MIYNPFTIASAPNGRFSRQPFVSTIIPPDLLDSLAKRLLGFYPLPNVIGTNDGLNNYYDPQPRRIDYHSQIVRIDHTFSERHRVFAFLSWAYLLESWANAFHNDASGSLRNRKHRGFSFDDVLSLKSDLILDLRYGIARFILDERPASFGFDLSSLGFPSSLTIQLDRRTTAFPEVVVDGYSTLGGNSGSKPTTNSHNASGIVDWMRGRHTLKFGSELRVLQENRYNYGSVSPRIENGATWTCGPLDNSPAAPIG